MSYQYKTVCYDTQWEAVVARAADVHGSVLQRGTEQYYVSVNVLTPDWPGHIGLALTPIVSGPVVDGAIEFWPQTCVLVDGGSPMELSVIDGSLVGGAVLAVWAVGWAIRTVIRSLRVDEAAPVED